MKRSKRLLVLAVVAALAVSTLALPAPAAEAPEYKVTITNLTDGQLMTPFVVATHKPGARVFKTGRPASEGVQAVAENGGVPVLVAELQAKKGFHEVAVAGAAPIAPGDSVEVYISGTNRARALSAVGMLICTNDGFAGLNRVRLPKSGTKTFYGRAYDAGTELNTEAYADLVPPCDGMGQTGMSNPALAENSKVRGHQGIKGIADLDPGIHGWSNPVIKVTVERVD